MQSAYKGGSRSLQMLLRTCLYSSCACVGYWHVGFWMQLILAVASRGVYGSVWTNHGCERVCARMCEFEVMFALGRRLYRH